MLTHRVLLWLIAALATACSAPLYMPAATTHAPPPFHARPGALEVGLARADITPPPGVSTFGHGPDARVTKGYWTRLYCRAFVFKQDDKTALAIVPCELAAMSTLLQRRAAKKLAEAHVPIPATRLMMTATHTHAGPAHYFDGEAYSGPGSTRKPGYDDAMVEFLASRIADSVARAYKQAKPARLRWVRGTVSDLTRNRDLRAFIDDKDAAFLAGCDTTPDRCAIDPHLAVLQIDGAHSGPMGWIAFFAMHPTVLPNTNQLLGGDVFGVASRAMEAHLRAPASHASVADPLVALVNTNEGDISPVWSSGTVEEAIRVGRKLAHEVVGIADGDHDDDYDSTPALEESYVEVDLRSRSFGLPPGEHTCGKPELGPLAATGASDHPTSLAALRPDGLDPRDVDRHDCQAPKRDAGGISKVMSGYRNFTSIVPIAVVRITDELVTFMPAELTATAGRRVDEQVLDGYGQGRERMHAVIAGLANGYIQYVTTPEEYDVQGYEGASTLFGPQTEVLLGSVARSLAARVAGRNVRVAGTPDIARAIPYWLGPQRSRLPTPQCERPLDAIQGQRKPRRLCRIPATRPTAVCFLWIDAAPGAVPIGKAPWVTLVAAAPPTPPPPLPAAALPGRIRLRFGGTVVLDDRGIAFRTRVQHRVGDAWLWSTLVQPTEATWNSLEPWGPLQIRVAPGTRYELSSGRFTRSGALPTCSVEEQRICGE